MNATQAHIELKPLRQDWPNHKFRTADIDGAAIVVTHPDGSESIARSGLAAQTQAYATRTTRHEGDDPHLTAHAPIEE